MANIPYIVSMTGFKLFTHLYSPNGVIYICMLHFLLKKKIFLHLNVFVILQVSQTIRDL